MFFAIVRAHVPFGQHQDAELWNIPETKDASHAKDSGNFGQKFKWKGSFWFLLTGVFGITSGGGPHISVRPTEIRRSIFDLTNRFFALIRELGNKISLMSNTVE